MTKKLTDSPPQSLNFESAFQRLEQILEQMNRGSVSLEEALKLYEEADQLITICNKQLNDAEKKVEILLKTRQQESQNENEKITQEFKPPLP